MQNLKSRPLIVFIYFFLKKEINEKKKSFENVATENETERKSHCDGATTFKVTTFSKMTFNKLPLIIMTL
jgi:hypothetical protein